jgi:uncharacterized membrane protein YedE/YeeE
MNRNDVTAFVAGAVFAIGLGISGMTQPDKVRGFLDVTGAWDPSLAFVMAGAIAVHFAFALRAKRALRPLFAESYSFSGKEHVDTPLVVGAAIFGLGWGAAGFCPGPAIVSLVTLSPSSIAFVAAMIGGMFAHRAFAPPAAKPSNRAD